MRWNIDVSFSEKPVAEARAQRSATGRRGGGEASRRRPSSPYIIRRGRSAGGGARRARAPPALPDNLSLSPTLRVGPLFSYRVPLQIAWRTQPNPTNWLTSSKVPSYAKLNVQPVVQPCVINEALNSYSLV